MLAGAYRWGDPRSSHSCAARCVLPVTEKTRSIGKPPGQPSRMGGIPSDSLSNLLVESTNSKLRLLTRVAYGSRSTDNLIARCLLDRGGYCPPLPGRQEAA